jgi:hypothetical protein
VFLNASQNLINMFMKYLKLLIPLSLLLFFSCGEQQYKEILPQSNQDSIKIKLEISTEKSTPGSRDAFSLKLTNTGKRDLGRCTLKFDNKYEHQLEGLINKDEDWEGKLQTSMLKTEDIAIIVFNIDIDNYSIFGITEKDYRIPEIIELNCLDGKVIWKINQQ